LNNIFYFGAISFMHGSQLRMRLSVTSLPRKYSGMRAFHYYPLLVGCFISIGNIQLLIRSGFEPSTLIKIRINF